MTSTINDTINQSLAAAGLGGYAEQARPVAEALIKREQDNAAAILEAASAQGIDPEGVRSLFEGLGIHLRDENEDVGVVFSPGPAEPMAIPPDTAAPTTMAEIEQRLNAHEARLNSLSEFARRHGWAPPR